MEKLKIILRRGCYFIEFILILFPRILWFRYKHPDGIFLTMTPEHQNLGDHAIAYAETQMLNRLGVSYYEITNKQLKMLDYLKLLRVLNGRVIFFTGGGNLGTLWPSLEKQIRATIVSNPDSLIVVFPNTVYYSDAPEDRVEEKKSVEIYNDHTSLYLYARERVSYEKMCSLYNNVKIVPDMVLSLDRTNGQEKRKGCILCLRWDCERTRTRAEDHAIRKKASDIFGDNILELDMCTGHSIQLCDREKELTAQFSKFRSSELVITDRLHGMIFCAITGTPCIVIDSKSPKVRGCYEWIRNLDYIRFADGPEQILELYQTMPKCCSFDNKHLQQYYKQLEEDIVCMLTMRR